MRRGYVKLWRKSLDSACFKEPKMFAFWTWCLLKATHREFDAQVGLQTVHLMPGQFIFGRREASKETGLTEKEIRGRLTTLKRLGNVAIKTAKKYSVITIVNWNAYQTEDSKNGPVDGHETARKGPHTITEEHKKDTYRRDALEVLSYFNSISLTQYEDASLIEARLREGATVDECRRVLYLTEMQREFRINNGAKFTPEAIFSKENWTKYYNKVFPLTKPDNKASCESQRTEGGC